MRYKAVVEVFFQITFKWSKWCAQTLHPFYQILKISSRIIAPIVAPSSDIFKFVLSIVKSFSSSKKVANSITIGLEKITLRLIEVIHYVTDTVELCKRYTKTENTLSPHTDVCCSISTKFCMMVEEVGAIISPTICFWIPSIV